MCTIGNVVKGIATVASVVIPAVNSHNEKKAALNYRTSLALNNMKEAKQEGLAQKQLGIEEARRQKIMGLRKASELMAQNASSGFSLNSGNNLYNYEDTIDDYYDNALDIQRKYNLRADNYFNDANDYLKTAKYYQKEVKNSLGQTALGATMQVASKWF